MDFLDPVKRRRHARRLMFGYALVAILILLITRFFVIWATGESINPRTGKINEYGLLFVDSKPGGSNIELNKRSYGTTSARLNLLAGTYEIRISKLGYYDWTNKLSLAGQSVERITYPLLFPKEPKPVALKAYASLPANISQSQDRHWLLIDQPGGGFGFDVFDTSKPTQAPTNLPLPSNLLTNTDKPNQALNIVGWSNDSNHFLIRHLFDGGQEFILFSRTDRPGDLNLNRQFNIGAADAAFNNGRADQVFLYDQTAQTVSFANIGRSTLTPEITKVSAWKAIDDNLILYLTAQDAPRGQVFYKIWDNGKAYKLMNLPIANNYIFDAQQYQSHWYYALGSDSLGRLVIYKDPLDGLKSSSSQASPLLSELTPGSPKLSFSPNGRFIDTQSEQQFNVYDVETQTHYKYALPAVPPEPLQWMDGSRLVGNLNNQFTVMDFDSQNQHQLFAANGPLFAYDAPYNHMYSFSTPAADGSVTLQITDLRAGTDQPKQ